MVNRPRNASSHHLLGALPGQVSTPAVLCSRITRPG
jgi:hypothetical protein